MTLCPVCAWFQENFPNEYAARDTEGKHERAAWFMLGRIQALEAQAEPLRAIADAARGILDGNGKMNESARTTFRVELSRLKGVPGG